MSAALCLFAALTVAQGSGSAEATEAAPAAVDDGGRAVIERPAFTLDDPAVWLESLAVGAAAPVGGFTAALALGGGLWLVNTDPRLQSLFGSLGVLVGAPLGAAAATAAVIGLLGAYEDPMAVFLGPVSGLIGGSAGLAATLVVWAFFKPVQDSLIAAVGGPDWVQTSVAIGFNSSAGALAAFSVAGGAWFAYTQLRPHLPPFMLYLPHTLETRDVQIDLHAGVWE
jgi:hypothetical protein